ncbi:MAG TPA: hypothetical protein VFB45_26680 [Pseudolabrys sp.]|nr:hypothetical protein [Pseudolabrys sp.]
MRLCTSTLLIAAITWLAANAGTQAAPDTGMLRVLSCKSEDATMEVYLPRSVIKGRDGIANVDLAQPLTGAYVLDLSSAGKGKILEQVRVSLTADKQAIVVTQFTRELPPTRIPLAGGTVDFDKRFAEQAKCGAFNSE